MESAPAYSRDRCRERADRYHLTKRLPAHPSERAQGHLHPNDPKRVPVKGKFHTAQHQLFRTSFAQYHIRVSREVSLMPPHRQTEYRSQRHP